jgi:hypothetical protein
VIPLEATSVSQEVSSRIATQATRNAPRLTTHIGTIEPELVAIAPRKVQLAASTSRIRCWIVAFIALFASTISIFWTAILNHTDYLIYAIGFAYFPFVVSQPFLETVYRHYFLLRHGVATRAMITQSKTTSASGRFAPEDHMFAFSFEFEGPDGFKRSSTFHMKRSRAAQLRLMEGSTFTVIYDPKRPIRNAPYFDINNATVVGRTSINISPP